MDTTDETTTATPSAFSEGTPVFANGFPGVVRENHRGDEFLDGMATVRLESGDITVPLFELQVR